ncbi:MAG: hypothetical protein KKA42_08965 [candidate division Zixibacteria bacterium]|nr:hypothetical protein [candidate division Zixibacteria bacterium]
MIYLKTPRQSVVVLTVLGLLLAAAPALAGNADESKDGFHARHQVGARIGGWSNQGASPADSVQDAGSLAYYLTDFSEANFYLEGFAAYRISPYLMGEISLGIVSRGDVTLVPDPNLDSRRYGGLLVYPILAKVKLYPLGDYSGKFHPFVTAGGGLYYARHDVQIVSGYDAFYNYYFEEDSKTSFSYVLGGGFDWPVAPMVGLEFNVQYMPIDFSSNLVGIQDYGSLTFTVGVKYLFQSTSDKSKR